MRLFTSSVGSHRQALEKMPPFEENTVLPPTLARINNSMAGNKLAQSELGSGGPTNWTTSISDKASMNSLNGSWKLCQNKVYYVYTAEQRAVGADYG